MKSYGSGGRSYRLGLACRVTKQRATNGNQSGLKSNRQFNGIGAVIGDLLPGLRAQLLKLHNLQTLIEPIQACNKAVRDCTGMPEKVEIGLEGAKGLGSLETVRRHFLHRVQIQPFDLVLKILGTPSIARDVGLDCTCHNTGACGIICNALGFLLAFLPVGDGNRYRNSEDAAYGLYPSRPFRRLITRRSQTLGTWWIDQRPGKQPSKGEGHHRNDEEIAIGDGAGHVDFLSRQQPIVGHACGSSRVVYAA